VIGEIKDGLAAQLAHRAAKKSVLISCEGTLRHETVVSKTAIGGENLSHSPQMPVWSATMRLVKDLRAGTS